MLFHYVEHSDIKTNAPFSGGNILDFNYVLFFLFIFTFNDIFTDAGNQYGKHNQITPPPPPPDNQASRDSVCWVYGSDPSAIDTGFPIGCRPRLLIRSGCGSKLKS